MSTIDLSRHATEFRKHYKGVRMQQGRVLTDDDFNEAERLDAEDARRVRADVIGPAGSPDDGFRLDIDAVTNQLMLLAGTFYVGGLRVGLEPAEPFSLQKDWLQQGANPGEVLSPAAAERFDFVWLDVWQQPLSAVEDKELNEVALGGADTSARIRTMRRARVLRDVGGADCGQAWQQLLTALNTQGTLNDQFELVPDAKLKIEPDGSAGSSDLCSPPVNGGYLGAENQAIRVQMVGNNRFTWGYDNAAPLYRVKLLADDGGALRRIHMLNLPKDQAHYILEGQVVELLPWSALLSNGQKAGELSGFLAKVTGGYNPDTQDFFIDADPGNDNGVPVKRFGERWNLRADAALIENEEPPEDVYYYLRVWNRGADLASPASIGLAPNVPVVLAKTGLQVTFTGAQLRNNDFWIIAARPETPNQFVPWELSTGRAPQGVRRWIAPLGIIRWQAGVAVPEVVHDCRPTFLPLTRLRGCCTFTVGDGTHSHGHFNKIQMAVDALPPEGGQVCVLPGVYIENVSIPPGRIDVTIHGCGPRSRVEAPVPAGGAAGAPVFTITACSGITIEDLAVIAAPDAAGILVTRRPRSNDIRLSCLYIEAAARSGIEVQAGVGVTIDHCEVIMADVFSPYPAVFLVARDGLVERNTLLAVGRGDEGEIRDVVDSARYGYVGLGTWTTAHDGRGGLQLGGQCRAVRVRDNLIMGGIGNGITLGSFRRIDSPDDTPDDPWIIVIEGDCEGCDPGSVIVVDPGGGDGGVRFVSAGPLREILIQENRIYRMGLCGIGVAGFFNLEGSDQFISVYGLTILRNDIRRCLLRELAPIPVNMIDSAGYGAICLADVEQLVIDDNNVADNGRTGGGDPICGIFILHGVGVDICRNHIVNNGPVSAITDIGLLAGGQPMRGRRGGINIVYALAPTFSLVPGNEGLGVQGGVPAARIHDNVVTTPLGQALSLVVLGPASIEGNQFTTRGVVQGLEPFSPSFLAATIYIFNLGLTTELLSLPAFWNLSSGGAATDGTFLSGGLQLFPDLQNDFHFLNRIADGNVMFVGNQVVLDLLDPTGTGLSLNGGSLAAILKGLEVSSILIATLDDVGFADNQCDCLLSFNRDQSLDFVISHAILAGWSVRMADNRMKEGLFNALFSGITFGLMNATTNNQSTHCILVYGPAGWKVNEGNRVLVRPFTQRTCHVQCLDADNEEPCTVKCETSDACTAFVDRHVKATGFYRYEAIAL